MEFADKRILITGSTRGIGRDLAQRELYGRPVQSPEHAHHEDERERGAAVAAQAFISYVFQLVLTATRSYSPRAR